MSIITNYTKLGFFEFYSMVKHVLNEDLWYLIYKKAMPKFEEGDICILSSNYSNILENITISRIYYNTKFKCYVYSYNRNKSPKMYCKYAYEPYLLLYK